MLSADKCSSYAEHYLGPQGRKVGSKVALIWIAQQISRTRPGELEAALKKYGWNIVFRYEAQLAEPDFTGAGLQARQAGADFVYSVMEVFSNIRLARAINRQGWNVPFFGLVVYDNRYIEYLGPAANNTWGVGPGPVLSPITSRPRTSSSRPMPAITRTAGRAFSFLGWRYARLFFKQGLSRLGPDITRAALLNSLTRRATGMATGYSTQSACSPRTSAGRHRPSVAR